VIKSTQNHNTQAEWEQRLLESAGLPTGGKEQLRYKLWRNPTNPNSLRLTKQGYIWAIEICKQTAYQFEADKVISNQVLLNLERLFEAPYFVRDRKHISLFSEQDSIMLELCGQNLEQYLNNLKS
jgi:hypothetical protein